MTGAGPRGGGLDFAVGAGETRGWIRHRSVTTRWDDGAARVAYAGWGLDSLPYSLRGNAPNPFNPSTQISFDLARDGSVELAVFDAAGRRVKTLVNGLRTAGPYTVQWNGTDDGGARVASGVYRYVLQTDDAVDAGSMVLLK